jgi:sugar phosphate isomerase/epimerase
MMLPFRLGSTSYVYDAGLAENAERLAAAGLVRDMELVLFDLPDGVSNYPDEATLRRLRAVQAQYDMSYTVHLPLDLRSTDGALHPSLVEARRVIELTHSLQPVAYVAHLDGTRLGELGWTQQAADALAQTVAWAGTVPLAIENLETYDASVFADLLTASGSKRCVDIGHLWKQGRDPLPLLDAWLADAQVVHLHGCVDGRDHISLAAVTPAQLDPVIARLAGFDGVLTLEVFGEADTLSSLAAFHQALERLGLNA